MPLSVALSAAASSVATFFTTSKVLGFIIKAGILFGASYLLQRATRPNIPERQDPTRIETFTSGPARWVLGRQKVGGVVMFWAEDWDVKGTERFNPSGGADDLHMVIAISEGELDGLEAVYLGSDRLDVKLNDDGTYKRREQDKIDNDSNLSEQQKADAKRLLPLDLDPRVNAYFDVGRNQWRETESPESRVLDENDEDDAETIRIAALSGAVSIIPYFDASNTGNDRWTSLRRYTDDLDNRYLREDNDPSNPQKPTPFADQWTDEHKLTGVSGVHIRLRQWVKHNFDERVFRAGTPNISFLVRGLRITHPDPESPTETITQFTDNAAAIRYWWHTERRGFPASQIDTAAFIDAYNVCEQRIIPDRPDPWPGEEEVPEWAKDDNIWGFKKYTINGVLFSGDDPAEIETEFDRAWQGQVVENNGRVFYYPGVDKPSVGTIDEINIIDYPQIAPAPSLTERINAVTLSLTQSSYHDFNQHSLNEIIDKEKRATVDKNYHAPQDLGEWRWIINPAAAYSIAVINLRRARYATTITLRLSTGTDDDPVKHIKMSPGLVYSINMPSENIINRRMSLQSMQIQEDMTVIATFLDAPIGIYESTYELPKLEAPPPYIPSGQGQRPPKPSNLVVESEARSSSDGTTHFHIKATVDDHPLRKIWRLVVGDQQWQAITESPSHTFDINVPLQIMELTVRHIDKTGVESLPIKESFTPDYQNIVLPTPRWKDAYFHGGTLRMEFEPDDFVAGVRGVEVRYTRQDLSDTSELLRLVDNTWDVDGEVLDVKPIQAVRGQAIVVDALVRRSGHYNLFARYLSSVSGTTPLRGPISAPREIAIDIAIDPTDGYEASPLWDVSYNKLYKWESKHGNTKGENLMLPDYDPADDYVIPTAGEATAFTFTEENWRKFVTGEPVKVLDNGNYLGLTNNSTYYVRAIANNKINFYDTKAQAIAGGSTGRRTIDYGNIANLRIQNVRLSVNLSSIPFDVWNGYVANSAVTVEPYARWPFGRVSNYGATFDDSLRDTQTGLINPANGGRSAWILTPPISLGDSSRRVEVRAEAYAYSPGTDAISNITFGGITIPAQRYKYNTAIPTLTMPSALQGVGNITYEMIGLPAGFSFDTSTRQLTGTPSVNNSVGKATYTATDALGGSVSLDFQWAITDDLIAPEKPTGLQLSTNGAKQDRLEIEWSSTSITNYYEVRWSLQTGVASWTTITPLFSRMATIQPLTANTGYQFQVRAVNGAGAGDWTDTVSATTAVVPVVPVATTAPIITSTNTTSVAMRWASVAHASTYEIRWKISTDANFSAAQIETGFASTVGQIDNLIHNTIYDFQVRARNDVGASAWSPTGQGTTASLSTNVPVVTITDNSFGPNEKRPYFEITTELMTNETGTDIAVTLLRPPEQGGDVALPTDYYTYNVDNSLTTRTFRYFQGVGPGGTYFIRVRKDFTPRSGIGLSRYSAWYEETRVFSGVPAQPNGVTNVDNPTLPTSLQLRITRETTATRYRLRYWKSSDPTAVLQTTFNDPDPTQPGNTTFIRNLQGLDDESTYNITLEAYNSYGWSLPSPVRTFGLPKQQNTPSQILNLKVAPISSSELILGWDAQADSDDYEVEVIRQGGGQTIRSVGITGNQLTVAGVLPGRTYTPRIRGRNSNLVGNAQYGPWRNFTQVTMPPTTFGEDPTRYYPIGDTPITASQNATNPRMIDWTFTCPKAAGVIGVQLQYQQSRASVYDGKVPDWVIAYENIFTHSFSSDGETFSGTFDPGFSSRFWEMRVRVLVDNIANLPYDPGFSTWGYLSNTTNGIQYTFQNGAKPMPTITPVLSQRLHGIDEPTVDIRWVPHIDDWESPDVTDGSSRNELRILFKRNGHLTFRLLQIPSFKYPVASRALRTWYDSLNYGEPLYTKVSRYNFLRIRREISIQPYYELWRLGAGDQMKVQIVRYETGRATTTGPEVSITLVDPEDASEVDPTQPIFGADTFNGRDVRFNWSPVAGADGYVVRLFQDNLHGTTPNDQEGVVVQEGPLRYWVKADGINEHFKVGVRTWRGNGSQRRYSTEAFNTYQPPATEVGKITGLRANPVGPDLHLLWDALPGDNNAFRYELSLSTDDGSTWGTATTIPVAAYSEGQIEHTMAGRADDDTLARIRAFKFDTDGTTKIYSTSWAVFRWSPTPTGDEAPAAGTLNPINEIAVIARDGGIHIAWEAPAHDGSHPEATRYRLQQRTSISGNWQTYQSGISGSVDEWDIVANPSVGRWLRVRPETFTQEGEWIVIPFVPNDSATVGAVDATGSATYTTGTVNWEPASNAQSYQLQYKSGTSGFGGAGGSQTTTTISGLEGTTYTFGPIDDDTHYQMRLRGQAGDSDGAWSDTINIDTLLANLLPAPEGLTIATTPTYARISWNEVPTATGYHMIIDAKGVDDDSYSTYLNAHVQDVNASVRSLDVNRLEFVPGLGASGKSFDIRARVRPAFFDSPQTNFSDYVSVRWGGSVPDDEDDGDGETTPIVATTGDLVFQYGTDANTPSSQQAPHLLSGTNGTLRIRNIPKNSRYTWIRFTAKSNATYYFRFDVAAGLAYIAQNGTIQRPAGGVSDFSQSMIDEGQIIIDHQFIHTDGPFLLSVTSGVSAGVIPFVSSNILSVAEGGTNTFTTWLNKAPTINEQVSITSNNPDITTNPTTLVFTPANWETHQTVTVSAATDADLGHDTGRLTLVSRPSLGQNLISVNVVDDTIPGIIHNPEGEGWAIDNNSTGELEFKLSHQPTANVTLVIRHQDTGLTFSNISGGGNSNFPATFTFTVDNWGTAQKLSFNARHNATESVASVFTMTANGGGYSDIVATQQLTVRSDVTPGQTPFEVRKVSTYVIEGDSFVFQAYFQRNNGVGFGSETNDLTSLNFGGFAQYTISGLSTITIQSLENPSTTGTRTARFYVDWASFGRTNVRRYYFYVTILDKSLPGIYTDPLQLLITEYDGSLRPTQHQEFDVVVYGTGTSSTAPGTVTFSSGIGTVDLQLLTINGVNAPSQLPTTTLTSVLSTIPTTYRLRAQSNRANTSVSDDVGNISVSISGGSHSGLNHKIPITVKNTSVVLTYAATSAGTGTLSTDRGMVQIPKTEFNGNRLVLTFNLEGPVNTRYRFDIVNNANRSEGVYNSNFTLISNNPITWRQEIDIVGVEEAPHPTSNNWTTRYGPNASIPGNTTTRPDLIRVGKSLTRTLSTPAVSTFGKVRITIQIRSTYAHTNIPLQITRILPSSNPASGTSATEEAQEAVAFGTSEGTPERVNLASETYEHVVQPSLNPAVLPTFMGHFPTQCWTTGVAIDDYTIPDVGNGLPPYTITASNLPAGITFDASARTLSGTPTDVSPLGGEASFTVSDANGNSETAYMEWAIASPVPSAWNQFGGGFGQFNNPFQMTCTTKGNMRPFYFVQGGTNAQAIIDNTTGARARAIWLKCPTTRPHTARLKGVGSPDYDLIIKVGDDWYVSDTSDSLEMLSVPGHEDGALIGVFRYEGTTTSTGVNNTGDPLTLEWFPDVEHLPTEPAGAAGLSSSATAERGANANATTPGESDTDVYVLYRNSTDGPWLRKSAPLDGWTDVGTNAQQIRFEVHLKSWENRALRRFTSFHRDKDTT